MPINTYIGARLLNSAHDYLYVEFYNGEDIVSVDIPLEYELFYIKKDSYQNEDTLWNCKGRQKTCASVA